MSAWQPIETAPKDGTPMWLSDGFFMRVGHWSEGRWADYFLPASGRRDILFLPTYWQPVPLSPQQQARNLDGLRNTTSNRLRGEADPRKIF